MSDFKNENDKVVMKSTQYLAEAVAAVVAIGKGVDGIRRGLASAKGIPADKAASAKQMAATMAELMRQTGQLMDLLADAGGMLASMLEPPIDPSLLN